MEKKEIVGPAFTFALVAKLLDRGLLSPDDVDSIADTTDANVASADRGSRAGEGAWLTDALREIARSKRR